MTERERWIVYPLLFLALGAALRDKLAKQTRVQDVVCQRLYLVDAVGRPQAEITGDLVQLNEAEIRCANLQALQVNSRALLQNGQPVSGQGVTWPQLLQLFQRMGLARLTPAPGSVLPIQPSPLRSSPLRPTPQQPSAPADETLKRVAPDQSAPQPQLEQGQSKIEPPPANAPQA